MKSIIVIVTAVFVFALSNSVFCADNTSLSVSGNITETLAVSLNVTGVNFSNVTDAGVNSSVVAQLVIKSNHIDGFQLTIHSLNTEVTSANAGQLTHTAAVGTSNVGYHIPYNIGLEWSATNDAFNPAGNGTDDNFFGWTSADVKSKLQSDTSQTTAVTSKTAVLTSDIVLAFDNPAQATYDGLLDLYLSIPNNSAKTAFSGNFTDDIKVTISNL